MIIIVIQRMILFEALYGTRLLVFGKEQQFYEFLVIGKKRISSNETSRLWQNRLTAKRNAQQNNLILLSDMAVKGLKVPNHAQYELLKKIILHCRAPF